MSRAWYSYTRSGSPCLPASPVEPKSMYIVYRVNFKRLIHLKKQNQTLNFHYKNFETPAPLFVPSFP